MTATAYGKTLSGAGARVVKLLQCIAEEPGSLLTLRPLAKRLQLPPSTVHRLLQGLIGSGLIERTEADAYRPGRELYRMASRLVQRVDVQTICRPILLDLWNRCQETCSICLYVPSELDAKVADAIPSPHPLRYVLDVSSTVGLAWGSLGHAILAYLPEDEIDRILRRSTRGPLSGAPAPSRAEFLTELGLIRRRRYAIYENRTTLNISGVAAPFFGSGGTVLGCVGITMPYSRSKVRDRQLCAALVKAAASVSAALGGDFPPRCLSVGKC